MRKMLRFLLTLLVAGVAASLVFLFYDRIWSWVVAAVLAVIALLGFRFSMQTSVDVNDIQGEIRRKGVYLGPISIWLFIAAVAYVPMFALLSLMEVVRWWNGLAKLSDLYAILGAPALVAVIAIIWVFRRKSFSVATATFAGLTFLGFRIWFYLTEGDYYFDPENFLIGVTTKAAEPFTKPDGALEAGEIAFQLWDSARRIDGRPNLQVKLNAMHGAGVILTVTLKGNLIDPQRNLTPNDAALLFGDSGRKAIRRASTVLVDLDISEVPGVLGQLALGYQVISARLSDTYRHHREGSLLLDKNGTRHYRIVPPGKSLEEAERLVDGAKEELSQWFKDNQKHFDPKVIELVTDEDELRVDAISIETTLLRTANEIGFKVTEVLVSDVELSETVQQSTNKASAEPHEAVSELRTAKSGSAAAGEYAAAVEKHGQDAVLLGAAATGTPGVQNINIPGLSESLKAIAGLVPKKGGRS